MTENIELKPCPFCGSDEVADFFAITGDPYIGCNNCSARGSSHDTKAEAIDAWNTRIASPRPEPSDDIAKTANKLARRMGAEFVPVPRDSGEPSDVIAAVEKERERCARIAENAIAPTLGVAVVRDVIAAAILSNATAAREGI